MHEISIKWANNCVNSILEIIINYSVLKGKGISSRILQGSSLESVAWNIFINHLDDGIKSTLKSPWMTANWKKLQKLLDQNLK